MKKRIIIGLLAWLGLLAGLGLSANGAASAFPLSNEDLRAILAKGQVTVEDGIKVLAAAANPEGESAIVDFKEKPRLASLKKDAPLTVGDFGVIAIELKLINGGLLYNITGLYKYAADALYYCHIAPAGYSFTRALSGTELINMVSLIREKREAKNRGGK